MLQAACRCVTDGPGSSIELVDNFALPPVWADHDRLEQVFVNLVDNAVRHGSGCTKVTVSAQVSSGGDLVTVRVTDDGPGIPRDLAERVFLPHERGMTSAPGAGLGLAIARGIVDAHGGTITLEPVAGGDQRRRHPPGRTRRTRRTRRGGRTHRGRGSGRVVSGPLTDTSTGSEAPP